MGAKQKTQVRAATAIRHEDEILAVQMDLWNRGYRILDTQWLSSAGTEADIVAQDGDVLVFVDVTRAENPEDGFPSGHTPRGEWEACAASWLAAHAASINVNTMNGKCRIRFDRANLILTASDCFFLQYHSNALGTDEAA